MAEQYRTLTQQLDQLAAQAEHATADAAQALRTLTDQLSTGTYSDQQTALTIVSNQTGGMGAYVAQQAERILGRGPLSGAWKAGTRAISPITSALSQALDDGDNPNYSVAERIGRTGAKALINGVPDMAAGVLGGIVGGAVGSVAGVPGEAVGTVVGGLGAAAVTDAAMNEIPCHDETIDVVGEGVDNAAHWLGFEE